MQYKVRAYFMGLMGLMQVLVPGKRDGMRGLPHESTGTLWEAIRKLRRPMTGQKGVKIMTQDPLILGQYNISFCWENHPDTPVSKLITSWCQ